MEPPISDDEWQVVKSKNQIRADRKKNAPPQPPPRSQNPLFDPFEVHGLPDRARAREIQRELNIDGLAGALTGDAARDLFGSGWQLCGVIRGGDTAQVPPDTAFWDYKVLEIVNRWNDMVVFGREVELPIAPWYGRADLDSDAIWARFDDDEDLV